MICAVGALFALSLIHIYLAYFKSQFGDLFYFVFLGNLFYSVYDIQNYTELV